MDSFSAPDTSLGSAPFAGLNAQERAVQALYLDALGRAGSKSELDFWVAKLPQGATALTPSCVTNLSTTLVPNNIRTPGGSIILAQAKFPYTPAVGYVVSGTINLAESSFMVPRNLSSVPRTDAMYSGARGSSCSLRRKRFTKMRSAFLPSAVNHPQTRRTMVELDNACCGCVMRNVSSAYSVGESRSGSVPR